MQVSLLFLCIDDNMQNMQKKYAQYTKYVNPISICRICTPDFADENELEARLGPGSRRRAWAQSALAANRRHWQDHSGLVSSASEDWEASSPWIIFIIHPCPKPDENDALSAKWNVQIWTRLRDCSSRLYTGTLKSGCLQRSNFGRLKIE